MGDRKSRFYRTYRVVKNTLNADGELSQVQSKKNSNHGYWTYADAFSYNSSDAVTKVQLGNGRWETASYNERQQITLNRLEQANERPDGWTEGNCTSDDPTKCWKQSFKFDRYGNRNFDEANTSFECFDKLCSSYTELCAELRKKLNPAVDVSDNRLASGQGYSFDAAGNTTRNASDRKFTYDAENKQAKVESLTPGTNTVTDTTGEYAYDGDGRRVKKYVPSAGEVTIFAYDAAGKQVAEYSTIVETTSASVAYLTNDHLASPRINTDINGNVTARHDYHPFGEEIATSLRTTSRGYIDDTVRKQFTGYERDNESDLDFAQARMYNPAHGRFTAVDPLLASAKPVAPQTRNRFSYVMNNPLKYVDPSGLCSIPSGLKVGQVGICVEAFIAAPRIGGFGHGDNRTHESNNPDGTARMRLNMIISTTETSFNQDVQEAIISPSDASVPVWRTPEGGIVESSLPSLQARGEITSEISSTTAQGSEGFGDGLNTSTTVRIGLRNGANGAQVLGENLQTTGAAQGASGNPLLGAAATLAGQAVSSQAPPGTIDVNAQIRITGSGGNIRVTGTAQSRPFPSVTGYAYTVNADGSIKTTQLFRQDETKPSDLTKPMRPIQ